MNRWRTLGRGVWDYKKVGKDDDEESKVDGDIRH